MLSFFKKTIVTQKDRTFKTKVGEFWNWYAKVAPRFFETIETGDCNALVPEVSGQLDKLFPGFAWVFGPGEGGVGHSFTLSGEGIIHKQLLTQFWLSHAPVLDGWTFYCARQPGSIEGMSMKFEGTNFEPAEFWLTPTVNSKRKKVDIEAWHPLVPVLGRQACLSALFIFLDEVLGEYGTEQWIGEIKVHDKKLADAIPLGELASYISKLQSEEGWEKFPPGEAALFYEFEQGHERFLRGDIIIATTRNSSLFEEYICSEGALEDPLAGTGADYLFITMDASQLPPAQRLEFREAVEASLDKRLKSDSNGRLLGNASSKCNSYIDLLIFDGVASINSVRSALEEQNVPPGTAINYFAREKRGHRIVL